MLSGNYAGPEKGHWISAAEILSHVGRGGEGGRTMEVSGEGLRAIEKNQSTLEQVSPIVAWLRIEVGTEARSIPVPPAPTV